MIKYEKIKKYLKSRNYYKVLKKKNFLMLSSEEPKLSFTEALRGLKTWNATPWESKEIKGLRFYCFQTVRALITEEMNELSF